jgi:exodeoxyribonuclease VII small subunit
MADDRKPELDSASFNKNYAILKETADWLAGQQEPDIDQLVPKVEKAMRAYAICKDRLDAVQETLGRYLQPKDGASAPSVGSGAPRRPGGDGDGGNGNSRDEVDIPF